MLNATNLEAALRHLDQNLERAQRCGEAQDQTARLFWLSQAVADWVFAVRCERDIGEAEAHGTGYVVVRLAKALRDAGQTIAGDWLEQAVTEEQTEQQLIEAGSEVANELYAHSRR